MGTNQDEIMVTGEPNPPSILPDQHQVTAITPHTVTATEELTSQDIEAFNALPYDLKLSAARLRFKVALAKEENMKLMQNIGIKELPDMFVRSGYNHYARIVNQANFRHDWRLSNKELNCLTLFKQLLDERKIMAYLRTERENSTIFQLRRSTSPPTTPHSSFTNYDHHTTKINRARAYDWIRNRQTVDALFTFAFMPDRLYAIEAKVIFLSSVTNPELLYDREINATIRNALLYLHMSPSETVLYCSRIRIKAKSQDKDINFQFNDCICGTPNILPQDIQPEQLQFEDHCCALFSWLKSRTTFTRYGYKIIFDAFTDM